MLHTRSPLITLWFGINTVIALAPPIYWYVDSVSTPVLGLPATLAYFLIVSFSITASILAAYADDVRKGALES
jgi:hypothetical protein